MHVCVHVSVIPKRVRSSNENDVKIKRRAYKYKCYISWLSFDSQGNAGHRRSGAERGRRK